MLKRSERLVGSIVHVEPRISERQVGPRIAIVYGEGAPNKVKSAFAE